MAAPQGFSKQHRLLTSREFGRVFKARNKVSRGPMGLYLAPNPEGLTRLGITVSKKVSKKAVERNRIKRVVREFFRCHKAELDGIDIIFNAFPGCAELSNAEIVERLENLWRRVKQRCD